ncbi:MAG TPA: 6,7-dimethyl-8-ribityllumazine synthase [Candidatus Thermoplasmatota archaeon]|nr:6,7-dimethyl-8-ribityllumazine synthase [Candidatus Thermoplasmatota archaeon]
MGRKPAPRKTDAATKPARAPARVSLPHLAIVVGEYNTEVTTAMEKRAVQRAHDLGYEPDPIVRVLGSYDLPFAVDLALQRTDVIAAVAIGAVVTGETGHDELIATATAKTLQELMLLHGKPIGLAITGPKQTYAQAEARLDRASAAVEAVDMMLRAAVAARKERRRPGRRR